MQNLNIGIAPLGMGAHKDGVLVWGRKPVSARGIKAAKRRALPLWTMEDGFIRSIAPGWQESPHSITLDQSGVYFDAEGTSALYARLAKGEFEDCRAQMELQSKLGVSKYNQVPRGGWTRKGYVLVVDQVRGDQSVTMGGASRESFLKALEFAQSKFPDDEILIRTHPGGSGYYDRKIEGGRIVFSSEAANPFDLIENAKAVICVTSQMGLDAIIAGKRPYVFGAPFYAGWGLSEDMGGLAPRGKLEQTALYDIAINQYCQFLTQAGESSDALSEIFALHDEARQIALAHAPLKLANMRAWKIPHMKRFFPNQTGDQILRWGARQNADEWVVEDGFLRSRGLGAALVPPLSLVVDKTGIYFDPTRPSDLEAMIHARTKMHPLEMQRAKNLREKIITHAISKYNLKAEHAVELPKGKSVILVVGQVEDDRSIELGATGVVKTNAELLKAVRQVHPESFIIYKPHPDVEAGLRIGKIDAHDADMVYEGESLEPLWSQIDGLATITSLAGFEALLRGKNVECYGMPFYADWGLTTDYVPSTKRRGRANLEALIYASLIDYPLYLDPKTRRLTTAEIIIDRLAKGETRYPFYLRAMTWGQQKFYRLRDYGSMIMK